MLSYYEKLLEYWEAGNIIDAVTYFEQWKKEGLLTQEEMEKLEKIIPDSWELLLGEFDNPEVIFNFYVALKEIKKWDDKTLCKELGISVSDIQGIRSHKKSRSKKAAKKVFLEFLQAQMKKKEVI